MSSSQDKSKSTTFADNKESKDEGNEEPYWRLEDMNLQKSNMSMFKQFQLLSSSFL